MKASGPTRKTKFQPKTPHKITLKAQNSPWRDVVVQIKDVGYSQTREKNVISDPIEDQILKKQKEEKKNSVNLPKQRSYTEGNKNITPHTEKRIRTLLHVVDVEPTLYAEAFYDECRKKYLISAENYSFLGDFICLPFELFYSALITRFFKNPRKWIYLISCNHYFAHIAGACIVKIHNCARLIPHVTLDRNNQRRTRGCNDLSFFLHQLLERPYYNSDIFETCSTLWQKGIKSSLNISDDSLIQSRGEFQLLHNVKKFRVTNLTWMYGNYNYIFGWQTLSGFRNLVELNINRFNLNEWTRNSFVQRKTMESVSYDLDCPSFRRRASKDLKFAFSEMKHLKTLLAQKTDSIVNDSNLIYLTETLEHLDISCGTGDVSKTLRMMKKLKKLDVAYHSSVTVEDLIPLLSSLSVLDVQNSHDRVRNNLKYPGLFSKLFEMQRSDEISLVVTRHVTPELQANDDIICSDVEKEITILPFVNFRDSSYYDDLRMDVPTQLSHFKVRSKVCSNSAISIELINILMVDYSDWYGRVCDILSLCNKIDGMRPYDGKRIKTNEILSYWEKWKETKAKEDK